MVPELEKPKITEIKVRMDCNGCVQKIKKALNGINGIYDIYIDFPEQKLTIIGWADPERIMKAIKKTRKVATICSHSEQTEPQPPSTEPPPQQEEQPQSQPPSPPPPPPPEQPSKETPPPPDIPKQEETPPPADNQPPVPDSTEPPQVQPQPTEQFHASTHPAQPSGSKDVGEVHVIHHHPPEYGYRYGYGYGHSYGAGHWSKYHNNQVIHEPQTPTRTPPVYVTHSYNTYKPPPPQVTEYLRPMPNQKPSPYVSDYEYVRTPQPPAPTTAHYSTRMERYGEEYQIGSSSNNGNITSIFSDENPNACSVM